MADLAWRLRHPETWPERFKWNYGKCTTCAMGLAEILSGRSPGPLWDENPFRSFGDVIKVLRDVEPEDVHGLQEIFLLLSYHRCVSHRDITPEIVADAIDAHLARKKVPVPA
jgi:hypothetical protein